MAITRTALIDDDGSGTSGTVFNDAFKVELYDQIDAALAGGDAALAQVEADIAAALALKASLGANTFTGAQTINGVLNVTAVGAHTFSASGAGDNSLSVRNTNAGASAYFGLGNNLTSQLGLIQAHGSTYPSGAINIAAGILVRALGAGGLSLAATDAAGIIRFFTSGVTLRGYAGVAGGLVWGAPTGGDKGAGTINASAVYDDNVLISDWVFDLHYDGHTAHPVPDGARLYPFAETRAVTAHERRLPWMPTRDAFEADRALGRMVTALWFGQEQQQLYLHELLDRLAALEATR